MFKRISKIKITTLWAILMFFLCIVNWFCYGLQGNWINLVPAIWLSILIIMKLFELSEKDNKNE